MDSPRHRSAQILEAVLDRAEREDYRDHSKHDALNSPLVRGLFGFSKWTRIAATQAVMRSPVDLRRLLGVPKVQNPKGLALFIQAHLAAARAGLDATHEDRAFRLCERLLALRSEGGWGYQYPWQDLGFFAPAGTPNAVVTAFACQALMDAHEQRGEARWLQAAGSALQCLLDRLPVLLETEEELCLGYMPMPMKMRVMDVSILIGAALARHARLSGDAARLPVARRLVNYVARRQTEAGAWYYCDPPGDSPVRIDNYHTGFILDALWGYGRDAGDDSHALRYERGLRFYAERLFNADGAPRWMSDQDFPHDVHGAAQGIITFARHRDELGGLAERISAWALEHLYSGEGFFYYQQRRFYTVRTSFMRWCNAWMARALACLIEAQGQA